MHQSLFLLPAPQRPMRPLPVIERAPCAACDAIGVVERESAGELIAAVCPCCRGRRYIEMVTK